MRRLKWGFAILLSIVLTTIAGFAADRNLEARRRQLKAALEDEWEYALRTHPEFATYVGDGRYNDKLSDHSAEAVAKELKHAKEALQRIEAIDTTGFPEQEKLNKELAVRELREQIEGTNLKEWEMPVNQMGGIHHSYASLPSQVPFRTVKDYDDYLARLRQMPFRKYAEFTAYSEGWAFYSEGLGKEVGFYQDPYSEYGRLENEMWRAVRLVVDTGVHYKHWSRDQMLDYFRQHTAMDEQNIVTEVDRYIAWPGQALAYKLGQMKIIELRERARSRLGERFDIRAFHDTVLAQGPVPLDVLEKRMDQWVGSQRSSIGQ